MYRVSKRHFDRYINRYKIALHRYMVFDTSRHRYIVTSIHWSIHRDIDTSMYRCNDVSINVALSRCRDVTKNVAKNVSFDVSIYVTLFCNDVTRYNALHKHDEPTGFAVYRKKEPYWTFTFKYNLNHVHEWLWIVKKWKWISTWKKWMKMKNKRLERFTFCICDWPK